jgi:hypothetical protein
VGRESDRDVGKTQSGLNRRESVPASAADRAATPGATPQAPGRRPPVLLLTRYFAYYHQARTHLALDKDAPDRRPIELPAAGKIVQVPEVGGLHHRYLRQAA